MIKKLTEFKFQEAFKKLWKVDALKNLIKLESDEGTVTRGIKNDKEIALQYIKYGFREGVKFALQEKSD